MTEPSQPDYRKVFVVHGRNSQARDDLFAFLRSVQLQPIEWSQALRLTEEGSPYVGQVIDAAFAVAQAIVVLLTPDDIAYLRTEYATSDHDPELTPSGQARPNVLFEAGLAFGRHPNRTILIEMGSLRPFSDVAGRHTIRMDGSAERRVDLINRLETAGCNLDRHTTDWLKVGEFKRPPDSGGGYPLGKRVPEPVKSRISLTASYQRNGKQGRLTIRNLGKDDIYDLDVQLPEGVSHSIVELPLDRLPAGESASFPMFAYMGSGPNKFTITIIGRDPEGHNISVEKFIDLV